MEEPVDNKYPWIPKHWLHSEEIWQDCGIYIKDISDYMTTPIIDEQEMIDIVDSAIDKMTGV